MFSNVPSSDEGRRSDTTLAGGAATGFEDVTKARPDGPVHAICHKDPLTIGR